MPNTSTSGGYLTQTSSSIDGQALRRFLQSVIVGVTGLDPTLVRPIWQQNPPPIPEIDTNWCGFAVTTQRAESGAYLRTLAPPAEGASLLRHEQLDMLCVFYGPKCLDIAAELRDGLELIQQNAEALCAAGMGINGFSGITHAPELINDRYFDRADITMTISREVRRNYGVSCFVGFNATVVANLAVESLTATVNVAA